jgi:hypothetical protein
MLHRQPGQPQQARRVISTVNHGPWLSSRCSKTQRGSRSHGPPSFRRAARVQTSGCPVKICECRCGAPGWRTTRLGAGDHGVTRSRSGRFGVPSLRLVQRGRRHRPGPPSWLDQKPVRPRA